MVLQEDGRQVTTKRKKWTFGQTSGVASAMLKNLMCSENLKHMCTWCKDPGWM